MNQFTTLTLAFIAGVFLAVQSGLNAHLGVFLKSSLLASTIAFFSSTIFAFLFFIFSYKNSLNWGDVKHVPVYLWFSGGFFSVLGISLYYYTIPKLGMSTMISLGLCGQIIFSVISGHFGWLNFPVEPITVKKIAGIILIIIGIVLVISK